MLCVRTNLETALISQNSHISRRMDVGTYKWKAVRCFKINLWSVGYVCLKIENCYLKIFLEIRVGEKIC